MILIFFFKTFLILSQAKYTEKKRKENRFIVISEGENNNNTEWVKTRTGKKLIKNRESKHFENKNHQFKVHWWFCQLFFVFVFWFYYHHYHQDYFFRLKQTFFVCLFVLLCLKVSSFRKQTKSEFISKEKWTEIGWKQQQNKKNLKNLKLIKESKQQQICFDGWHISNINLIPIHNNNNNKNEKIQKVFNFKLLWQEKKRNILFVCFVHELHHHHCCWPMFFCAKKNQILIKFSSSGLIVTLLLLLSFLW